MITATFDGAEREFGIKREHVPFFEAGMRCSVYSLLRRLTDGNWLFDDVARVISFALHGPWPPDLANMKFARHAANCGIHNSISINVAPRPDVLAVLHRDGHGNFASLAADILTDCIFGEVGDAGAE